MDQNHVSRPRPTCTSKQNRMIIVVVQTPLPVERVAVERDDVEGFAVRKGVIL